VGKLRERETNPGKWYPKLANGEIDRNNDTWMSPARHLNHQEGEATY
jgi:hypothetical protein